MKRLLLLIITALAISHTNCSKENDMVLHISDVENDIWKTLQGSYTGTYYIMQSETVWYTETISFQAYAEPKEIFPMFTYDTDDHIYAFGEATINDTRFSSISGTSQCYYVIKERYLGATPTITFYEKDDSGSVIGREDKRELTDWSSMTITIDGTIYHKEQ